MRAMPFDTRSLPADIAAAEQQDATRAIAFWLLGVAGMVWFMVGLGGATRLTGSGLSIMEWAPIAGTLPPLSQAEWQRLYDLYRTIPQYQLVNQGFGIEGFKEIFWLEWGHRLWGRLIGLAYVAGLAWFWLRSSPGFCCCWRWGGFKAPLAGSWWLQALIRTGRRFHPIGW
jgi:cytochrome c oxidase assembly protein subunit 15